METKDKKIKDLWVWGVKEFEVQTDESIARNEIPSKEEGWKKDGFHPSMKFLTSYPNIKIWELGTARHQRSDRPGVKSKKY